MREHTQTRRTFKLVYSCRVSILLLHKTYIYSRNKVTPADSIPNRIFIGIHL